MWRQSGACARDCLCFSPTVLWRLGGLCYKLLASGTPRGQFILAQQQMWFRVQRFYSSAGAEHKHIRAHDSNVQAWE
eukprot:6547479-Karenia_brevis.AAC.1